MTPSFKLLGDPHLGRQFVNNVPLHRRGDRERMQWEAFVKGLNPKGAEVHVNMGDLFDKPIVSLGVIHRVALAYLQVADDHPEVQFVILKGNHDDSRDMEMITAFDVFTQIVRHAENIHVVHGTYQIDELVFFGWDPLVPAAEIVKSHTSLGINPTIAFGHYDVHPLSDAFNMIPVAELRELGVQEVFIGHDHLKREEIVDGMPVHVVGSMLPYAHGEDADGTTYVTLSLEEARTRTDLHDCCVRIDLQPGETFDLDLDCLQLQVRRVTEERESIEVELGEFNLNSIFDECMRDVPDNIRNEVKTQWDERFSTKQ
jgi:DNA repair exonuclease SbcCD nuclease subunit